MPRTDQEHPGSLRVECPDPEHDDRPIQLQAGGDRVLSVDETGQVIVSLSVEESENLRRHLRGMERAAKFGGEST